MPGRVEGTDMIFFIKKKDVLAHRWQDITYGRIVVSFRPTKDDSNRTRLTMVRDCIVYPRDCGTPTVDLLTVKLHQNITISTKNAQYMTIDIKNFYLNTPMGRFKYMRLKISDIPADVVKHYNLEDKVAPDGWVYLEVHKGVYGLPQTGMLAHKLLEKRLNKKVYVKAKLTPGFWSTSGAPSRLIFASITLALNMSAKNMLY